MDGRKGSDHELEWAMKRWSLSCQRHGWYSCREGKQGIGLTRNLLPQVLLLLYTLFLLCRPALSSDFVSKLKGLHFCLERRHSTYNPDEIRIPQIHKPGKSWYFLGFICRHCWKLSLSPFRHTPWAVWWCSRLQGVCVPHLKWICTDLKAFCGTEVFTWSFGAASISAWTLMHKIHLHKASKYKVLKHLKVCNAQSYTLHILSLQLHVYKNSPWNVCLMNQFSERTLYKGAYKTYIIHFFLIKENQIFRKHLASQNL